MRMKNMQYVGEVLLESSSLVPRRPHTEETSNRQFHDNIRQPTET